MKNPPAMWETWFRTLGWEDPLERNGNLLQYCCLENSMDRRAWPATNHGVTKRLSDFSFHPATKVGILGAGKAPSPFLTGLLFPLWPCLVLP